LLIASVIIPVFNGAATLERTIQSFLGQNVETASWFEIVLCDDGSTDASGEILARYADHPRVTVIYQENQGQSAASNQAARQAKGDLLIFSAQDIVPQDADFICNHLRWHAGNNVEKCVNGYIRYPKELLINDFMVFMQDSHQQFDYRNIPDLSNIDPMKLYAPNFSVKKSWFEKVGGFDPQFPYGFQDTDLGIRLSLAGLTLFLVDNINCWHYHPIKLQEYAAKKRAFGRMFWNLFFKQRHFFENICRPRTSLPRLLQLALHYASKRELIHRIGMEIVHCEDNDIEPLYELYDEFSKQILSLPPLRNDMPKSKKYWCMYLFYSAYLTFYYNQGLSERAMEIGLLKEGLVNVDHIPLPVIPKSDSRDEAGNSLMNL
jgi:glycosyltransferase involved in cell wall biosynthesis